MGLSINYTLRLPANMQPAVMVKKFSEVRKFARTLPVTMVYPLSRNPAHFRSLRSLSGQYGCSTMQKPIETIGFNVDVRPGCEWMGFCVSRYPKFHWRVASGPDAYIACLPADEPAFVAFRRKWKLTVLPKNRRPTRYLEGTSRSKHFQVAGGGLLALLTLVRRDRRSKEVPTLRVFGSYQQETVMRTNLENFNLLRDSKQFECDLRDLYLGRDQWFPADQWVYEGSCKTCYATNPADGGMHNFVAAHLAVLSILEHARRVGFDVDVHDEGGFWEHHDVAKLMAEVDGQNAVIAGMAMALSSVFGKQLESPIMERPDYKKLAEEGAKHPQIAKLLAVFKPAAAGLTGLTGGRRFSAA
jgi:hypothetical protein